MADAPSILALDIATNLGWALGRPGERPAAGSLRVAPQGATEEEIGAGAARWLLDMLTVSPVDALYFEAPLDPRHMGKRTNFSTATVLIGLAFMLSTLAHMRGVARIRKVQVRDARKHFLGAHLRGEDGKAAVLRRCLDLGWAGSGNARFDDNAADALAVWSFACADIEKRTGVAR